MKPEIAQPEIQFIKIRDVIAISGLSRASIYSGIKQGKFPAQVKLSARSAAWVKSEILEWAAARVRASRSDLPLGKGSVNIPALSRGNSVE